MTDAQALSIQRLAFKFAGTVPYWPKELLKDDFVQDVLLKLLKGKPLHPGAGFSSYVYRTCWSVLSNWASRRRGFEPIDDAVAPPAPEWQEHFTEEARPLVEGFYFSGERRDILAKGLGLCRTRLYDKVSEALTHAREAI